MAVSNNPKTSLSWHTYINCMRHLFLVLLTLLFVNIYGQDSKRVLIIGIDGVRSDALQSANTPNIDQLLSRSNYSFNALNDDITVSGPGWSAMLCGVWSDKHGVTNNGFSGSNYGQYPHIFKRIEDARPALNTVSISQWHPINNNILQGNADFIHNASSEADVTIQAVNQLSNFDPHAIFLHYDEVDYAGHGSGFSPSNQTYLQAIESVDRQVGEVIRALTSRMNYQDENWLILLSTDHGGLGSSHGGSSPEEETIFLIAHNKHFTANELKVDSFYKVDTSDCLDYDKSLFFDGNDDYVNVPHFNELDFGASQDFTIECWVNTGNAADVSVIGNKDWDSGNNAGFVFSFRFASGPEWKVNLGDGSNRADINTGGSIADNLWHHIAVTFDRDGFMTMYEDGVKRDSISIASIQNMNNGAPLRFGADINGAYDFEGKISEVRLWNTVLSSAEIDLWRCDTINNNHPNYSNLIGYWPLNEGSGQTVYDRSPLQNNGSITNASWIEHDSILEVNPPKITDIAVTALNWLCIPSNPTWNLDGKNQIKSQFIVSTTMDSIEGSLRYIMNNTCPEDTIFISPDLNGLDIIVDKGVLIPDSILYIKGNGPLFNRFSANYLSPIFRVEEGSHLNLQDILLKRGKSDTLGGAIQNYGHLFLNNVHFEENFEGNTPKTLSNLGQIQINGNVDLDP